MVKYRGPILRVTFQTLSVIQFDLISLELITNKKHLHANNYTAITKSQLISKCLFGVFTFFQKTDESMSTSSKVEFVFLFFGRNGAL